MKKLTILSYLIAFILFIAGCNTSTNNSSNNPVSSSDSESKQGSSGEKVEVVNIEKDEISIEDEQDDDSVKKHEIPFEMGDFILSVTPSGEIDSAGGVYYSYEVKNNSSIPVKEMRLSVKLEFEDGQSLVDNISINDTIMNEGFSGGSNETVYPEPASKIKSYQLIGYEVLDTDGFIYTVDLQLEAMEVDESYVFDNVTENAPFEINDFALSVSPSGEIDSAGGVYYSYEIKNNSSIPVKEMRLSVKLEFEDGQSLVDNISINDTIMNEEFSGGSNETVYPEPASKIKSYQLIGYQIIDKEDNVYDVDTQLNLVQKN